MITVPKKPLDPLGDEVAFAYIATTPEQRRMVGVDHFAEVSRDLCSIYAKLLNISREGLLIASLLEIEHPSICNPGGRPRANNFGVLLKLAISYNPVDK